MSDLVDTWQICTVNDDDEELFFVPLLAHFAPSAADVQDDWVYTTPPTDTWLVDTIVRAEARWVMPSYRASDELVRVAEILLGATCFALSLTLYWHQQRMHFGKAWSINSDERAAARVASRFRGDASCMIPSEAVWDKAIILCFDTDPGPSEERTRAIVTEYIGDVDADARLAHVLFVRCGVSVFDRSNWLVECDALWPSDE